MDTQVLLLPFQQLMFINILNISLPQIKIHTQNTSKMEYVRMNYLFTEYRLH